MTARSAHLDARERAAPRVSVIVPVLDEARVIERRLDDAGFRNVEKIEREHGLYEARATDRNGARVKLHINPQTGEVTERNERNEHRKRDREGASGEGRYREGSASAANSADCNKRRCRDDMPQTSAAAQTATK